MRLLLVDDEAELAGLRNLAHALRRSLSWRLIWCLIALYVASLAIAVVGLMIFAWSARHLDGVETNKDFLKTPQAAVVRDDGGSMVVRPRADPGDGDRRHGHRPGGAAGAQRRGNGAGQQGGEYAPAGTE
jgi:hypothetical protein